MKVGPDPEAIKLFSCSTQLRQKFILLINVKMPTTVGIITFISRINYRLWQSEPEISTNFGYFSNYEHFKESVTISIYKCLWFEGKIKVGHCSLDSHVSFPEYGAV